ncbi:MAG: nuclear transport factor 2 family protein [Thermoleophilaceae bacterium]
MTVEEMLALYNGALAAFEAGDYDGFVDTVDPRLVFITVPEWPDGGTFEGPEATWRFLEDFKAVFAAGAFEIIEPVAVTDSILVHDMRRLTSGGQSGAAVEWHYTVVTTFRSGRMIRTEYFDTRQEALAAARGG